MKIKSLLAGVVLLGAFYPAVASTATEDDMKRVAYILSNADRIDRLALSMPSLECRHKAFNETAHARSWAGKIMTTRDRPNNLGLHDWLVEYAFDASRDSLYTAEILATTCRYSIRPRSS